MPQSLESWLQEAGRGGRDRLAFQAILLIAPTDLLEPINEKKQPFSAGRARQLLAWLLEDGCVRLNLLRRLGVDVDSQQYSCSGCSYCNQKAVGEDKSYWQRIMTLNSRLAGRRLHGKKQGLVSQWLSQQFYWENTLLPGRWVRSLPRMPEWSEGVAENAVNQIWGVPARVQGQFKTLLQRHTTTWHN
ncbi:MAG: hypothetical protein D6B26_02845 [Spirochaetaceae bacterium]|nr:MAG: hypothetical protein D6B26_02845 [Spirochaetaceae bacterium]